MVLLLCTRCRRQSLFVKQRYADDGLLELPVRAVRQGVELVG